jgi:hypothetical protein
MLKRDGTLELAFGQAVRPVMLQTVLREDKLYVGISGEYNSVAPIKCWGEGVNLRHTGWDHRFVVNCNSPAEKYDALRGLKPGTSLGEVLDNLKRR